MAIIFNDNLSIHANKPIDNRYVNISTPWSSTSEVNANILEPYRYIGLTVNINNVEYWYYSGTTDSDLIIKSMVGTVSGATNGITLVKNNSVVSLGGTLTGNTVFNGGVSGYNLQYGGDYSSYYTNRSLVDKEYVDSIASGLKPKQSVMVATTTNITLSGLTIVDGYQLQTGDRVLVKDQISGATNGIYSASTGIWGRTSDFDGTPSSEVVSGSYMFVITGNTNTNSAWILSTADPITIGVTPLTFVMFTHTETITNGVGITISATTSGKQISFDGASVAGSCLSWNGTQLNLNSSSQGVLNGAITGATNGLTKVGRNVKLGGLLFSGETTVNMPYSEPSSFVIGYGTPVTWTGGRLKICRDSSCASGNVVCIGARTDVNNSMVIAMYATSGMTFATSIGGVSHGMKLDGAALAYDACYHADYTKRSLVDKEYVTGVTSSLISTANNGLNKIGNNVRLGGTLTGNTSIYGNYTLSICDGAQLNTVNGYQISGDTILKTSKNNISSIFVGVNSGTNSTAANNFGAGSGTLAAISTGHDNVAIGYNVLNTNNVGNNNIGVGCQVLSTNVSGNENIAVGYRSLYSNSTGSVNIAIGSCVLCSNSTGSYNIGMGLDTMCIFNNGDENVAIGTLSMVDSLCGFNNVALGSSSLKSNAGGNNNIAIGRASLCSNIAGCDNISIGCMSLFSNLNGSNNVVLGKLAGHLSANGNSNVFIGYCAGYNEQNSNKLYIANTNACNLIYGEFDNNFVTLPTLKLCNTPGAGSTSDGVLVWNSTDKCVKQISCACAFGSTITGATNGLTKTGKNVVLGGTLTGNTSINLNSYDFRLKSDGATSYGYADFNLSQTYANSKFSVCSQDGTMTSFWGISGNSTNITAVHCSNSSNGSCLSINNSDVSLVNKTSNCSRTLTLGANALVYGACYHVDYTNRSLVDKEYVDVKICNESNVISVCNVGVPYTTTRYDDFIGVSGTSCIYLYNTPVLGQRIVVTDICGQALINPITVDGNGKKINDGTCSTINTNYGSITYIYNGFCWSAVGFVN